MATDKRNKPSEDLKAYVQGEQTPAERLAYEMMKDVEEQLRAILDMVQRSYDGLDGSLARLHESAPYLAGQLRLCRQCADSALKRVQRFKNESRSVT